MKQRADMADNECRKIADKASKEKNECEKIENSIKTALEDMDIETENTVEEIAENIKNELANAKEQLEIAEKRNTERIECELNLNVYTENCNQTDEKIEEITAKINDLKKVINGDENKIAALEKMISCKNKSEAEMLLDDLENRIDEMQKSFEIAEQNYNECVKVIDNAKAVINENEPLAKTENERIKKQEEKLEKAMQKYGIDDENTLEILVSDIENISDMRDEIKEYDNKLSACNERIKMLKQNIGKAEKTDIEKLKADKEETENSLEEITEQKNSLTANISINKRIMDETQKLKTELDESGKRYSTYLNISQTANGELSKRQKIAFEQYRIIPPNIWVGMQYFATLMSSPVFWQVIQNTVIIGAMKLIFIFPVPIIVALLLNEVRSSGYRKFVQSVIYLPHYLSWVVIASIAIATLSPVDGAVNDIIKSMGYDPIPFMTDSGSIRWVLVFTEMWRSAGWDSLLYIAAILAIDPQLYEAAEMDGAGRWRKIWHITLPAITPTIATLFILNVGLFLSQGFDQVFNMTNDVVNGQIDIIDTYVYRMGLRTGEFSLATAAGLFKGVIGMVLIVLAHNVSKRLTGKGVW